MYTEDEAKKKWCPQSSGNGGSERCIASGCMAWRLGLLPSRQFTKCANSEAMTESEAGVKPAYDCYFEPADQNDDDHAYWIETSASIEKRRPGYCGLAGNPRRQ